MLWLGYSYTALFCHTPCSLFAGKAGLGKCLPALSIERNCMHDCLGQDVQAVRASVSLLCSQSTTLPSVREVSCKQ